MDCRRILESTGAIVMQSLRSEVEELFYLEAHLLDEWRLDEWLALLTDDCRYVVPSTDLPDGNPDCDVVLVDDSYEMLTARIERLKSRFAYREFPWSRTRRLITNVRVDDDSVVIRAWANFVVYRFRQGESTYVGHYEYLLVRRGGELRIAGRRAVLDNEALDEHGAVSIIL